jgi:hypothetical protein
MKSPAQQGHSKIATTNHDLTQQVTSALSQANLFTKVLFILMKAEQGGKID